MNPIHAYVLDELVHDLMGEQAYVIGRLDELIAYLKQERVVKKRLDITEQCSHVKSTLGGSNLDAHIHSVRVAIDHLKAFLFRISILNSHANNAPRKPRLCDLTKLVYKARKNILLTDALGRVSEIRVYTHSSRLAIFVDPHLAENSINCLLELAVRSAKRFSEVVVTIGKSWIEFPRLVLHQKSFPILEMALQKAIELMGWRLEALTSVGVDAITGYRVYFK